MIYSQDQLSDGLEQLLREMRSLFGDQMWDNILVGVSKWSYEQCAIDHRNKTCIFTPSQCRDEKVGNDKLVASPQK